MAGNLPAPEDVARADIDELRTIATELTHALQEARTSAAHFKLQHNLLLIEHQEYAQRQEVEHQMTRREVEVLQTAEHQNRTRKSGTARLTQIPSQQQLDGLTRLYGDLREDNEELEGRLRKAKKIIDGERDKNELLFEENMILKRRIRENREHYSRMKSQSPIYATPRNDYSTPSRKAVPRFADSERSHAPFAALLAADQVLSGEAASVPSTPTKSTFSKQPIHGHTRGAHSLSSLQTTPTKSRPVTADDVLYSSPRFAYSAPSSQLVQDSAERERRDRDSTISISDAEEEAITDDELPQSQASSLATNMLRRNPGSQQSSFGMDGAKDSSNLLQTKLFGSVKKAGVGKRKAVYEEGESPKKGKLGQGVGLGIGV